MSSARSFANQKLYHARILAAAWRRELKDQQIPSTVLSDAFDPPCRRHLQLAYGWFVLEIAQLSPLPAEPPARCAELPDVAQGKAIPPEIRELQQLEKNGWIAQLLQPGSGASSAPRSVGNLATAVEGTSGPDAIDQWIEQLQTIFERMSEALDEY